MDWGMIDLGEVLSRRHHLMDLPRRTDLEGKSSCPQICIVDQVAAPIEVLY